MTKVADGIRRGLQEAVAYARGEAKESDYRVMCLPRSMCARSDEARETRRSSPAALDSASIRCATGNQGKRQPEGPTSASLLVIERAPKAVQKALHAA